MINEYTIGGAIVLATIVGIWGWRKLGVVIAGRNPKPATKSKSS